MAFELYGAAPFTGGSFSITTQTIPEDGYALLYVGAKPTFTNISTPAGFTQLIMINGVNSTAYIGRAAVSAGSGIVLSGTITINGSQAGDGVVGYVLSDQYPSDFAVGSTQTETGNQFTVTHTSPAIASVVGDLITNYVLWNQYPREGATTDSTERWDEYAGFGPGAALGSTIAAGTTAGPFVWKSDDPNSPSADPLNPGPSGTEQSVTATVRWIQGSAPTQEPAISGGGEIPVVDLGTTTWTGFSVFSIASTNSVTLTVLDEDGSPFSDLPLVFSVTGSNTLSATNVTTNTQGQAPVDITTPLAGNYTISASLNGSQIASRTFTVAGNQVSLVVSPTTVLEGGIVMLSGEANDANGNPVANTPLSFSISGGSFASVGAAPVVTTASGTYTYQIQPTSVGTLTVSVTVGAVISNTETITVEAIPDPEPEDTALRLRKQDYIRTKPVKR